MSRKKCEHGDSILLIFSSFSFLWSLLLVRLNEPRAQVQHVLVGLVKGQGFYYMANDMNGIAERTFASGFLSVFFFSLSSFSYIINIYFWEHARTNPVLQCTNHASNTLRRMT